MVKFNLILHSQVIVEVEVELFKISWFTCQYLPSMSIVIDVTFVF